MRTELKYLVPEAHLGALRAAVAPFVALDPYERGYEGRGYTVRSIYLDTAGLRYYEEKQAGLKTRLKLRIRAYNTPAGDDPVFLEIKRKDETTVSKDRVPVPFADLEPLFATGDLAACLPADAAVQERARRFFYHVYGYQLRPTSLTVYEREAFAGRFDPTLRITFDRNLRGKAYPSWADLGREAGLAYVHPGCFIVEVKFNTRFPEWLRPVLGRYGLRQQSLSKYGLCLETCRREADSPIAVLARARFAQPPSPRPVAAPVADPVVETPLI
jgi:hypothetical protein